MNTTTLISICRFASACLMIAVISSICQPQDHHYNWLGDKYAVAATASSKLNTDVGSSAQKVQVDQSGKYSLSIPLMNVPGRNNFDFLIKLNYTPGIKVTQEASWVGLGWSLDPGRVSRSVIDGIDDYVNTSSLSWADQYLISTPAGGGKILRFPQANSDKFRLEEWKGWSFQYDSPSHRWIVKTEDGTTYVFAMGLVGGTSSVYARTSPKSLDYPGVYENTGDPYMEWVLTAILSNDYVDAEGSSDPYDPLDFNSSQNSGKWIAFRYSYDGTKPTRKFFYTMRYVTTPMSDGLGRYDAIGLYEITYPQSLLSG